METSTYRQMDLWGLVTLDINKQTKTCIYCKEQKELSEFPKHKQNKDGIDNRCKCCIKKQAKIRNKIRKTAPPKSEICECCGQEGKKIVLDHDHETNKFRGWLCDQCNRAIGQLGDNVEGLQKAINYLSKDNV